MTAHKFSLLICILLFASDRQPAAGPMVGEATQYPQSVTYFTAGVAAYWQGKHAQAETMLGLALKDAEQDGSRPAWVAVILKKIAELYEDQGKYEKARRALERTLAIEEKILGRGAPRVITDLNNLTDVYYILGEYDKAEAVIMRVIETIETRLGPNHPHVAVNLHDLAVVIAAQGRHAEANQILNRALSIFEKQSMPESFLSIVLRNWSSQLNQLHR